jgi:hypothetical protein
MEIVACSFIALLKEPGSQAEVAPLNHTTQGDFKNPYGRRWLKNQSRKGKSAPRK